MANPTTNYGFVLPTPTDLVTDLPADFEVALQGVDTQMKTNADAATTAANAAIQKSVLTTTGDTLYASGANTPARLGIGTTGQVLQVSGGLPAWGTPPSSDSMVSLATGSLSGVTNVSITSISGIYRYLVLSVTGTTTPSGWGMSLRFNSDTGNNYEATRVASSSTSLATSGSISFIDISDGTTTANAQGVWVTIPNYASTAAIKMMNFIGGAVNPVRFGTCVYRSSSAITSIQIQNGGGVTFGAGTYTLWGVK
jgi:hypothetical protein